MQRKTCRHYIPLGIISSCASVRIYSLIIWDSRKGLRDHLSNPDSNLESPCQVLANWLLYTCTQTRTLLYCTQTALQARRHWQLPVVLFPQVPGVTQPLPDRSNHRWGLFRSHPRVKAQHAPKEMTETYESIALFFSSFLTPFWMQVWGLITVSGEEVDFIHPGTHQKKKDCTEIEAVSVAPASKIAIAAPENSQKTNQILKCQCQNGKNIQHPLLTAFGQGFIHHYCTASCCSLPMLLITGLWAPVDTFLLPETPYTKSTCLLQCSFWPSPNAVWSVKFTWMISSKISISVQMYL